MGSHHLYCHHIHRHLGHSIHQVVMEKRHLSAHVIRLFFDYHLSLQQKLLSIGNYRHNHHRRYLSTVHHHLGIHHQHQPSHHHRYQHNHIDCFRLMCQMYLCSHLHQVCLLHRHNHHRHGQPIAEDSVEKRPLDQQNHHRRYRGILEKLDWRSYLVG